MYISAGIYIPGGQTLSKQVIFSLLCMPLMMLWYHLLTKAVSGAIAANLYSFFCVNRGV